MPPADIPTGALICRLHDASLWEMSRNVLMVHKVRQPNLKPHNSYYIMILTALDCFRVEMWASRHVKAIGPGEEEKKFFSFV